MSNKKKTLKAASRRFSQNERQVTKHPPAGRPVSQVRTLKGCKPERGVALYLEHIQFNHGDTDEDIVDLVRAHGMSNNLRVITAHVVHNRVCPDIVGCKITVPLSQVGDAMVAGLWAEDITCRKWENRRRDTRQKATERKEPASRQQRRGEAGSLRRDGGNPAPAPHRDTRDGRPRISNDTRYGGPYTDNSQHKPPYLRDSYQGTGTNYNMHQQQSTMTRDSEGPPDDWWDDGRKQGDHFDEAYGAEMWWPIKDSQY